MLSELGLFLGIWVADGHFCSLRRAEVTSRKVRSQMLPDPITMDSRGVVADAKVYLCGETSKAPET